MPTTPRPDAPNTFLSAQVATEQREIADKINGLLSLGRGVHAERTGNLDGQWLRHVFPAAANTEIEVYHGLGRVPVGYIPCEQNLAGSVYSSRKGSWTDTVIYLKSDVASLNVLLMVF